MYTFERKNPTFCSPYPGGRKLIMEKHFVTKEYKDNLSDEDKRRSGDIALIKLRHPYTFSSTVLPACIKSSINSIIQTGVIGRLTGCGRTATNNPILPPKIQFINAVIQRDNQMNGYEDSIFAAKGVAKDQNSCLGDAGGPFIKDNRGTAFAIGVANGYTDKKCEGGLALFVNVEKQYTWIVEKMIDHGTVYV